MRSKLLALLSILVSLFIVLCIAIILMMQFPDLKENLLEIIRQDVVEAIVSPTKERNDEETSEVVKETETEVEIVKTPEYVKEIYVAHNNNVQIEYPVIKSALVDDEKLLKINQKIYDNAISIVKLYPISTSMQKLTINSTVEYLDNSKITILYEGEVVGKTVREGEKSSSSSGGNYTGSSSLSDNPSNNYQIPGATYIPNGSNPINEQNFNVTNDNRMYIPETVVDYNNLPTTNRQATVVNPGGSPVANNYGNSAPGAVFPQNYTINIDQKIFYTNTIDLNLVMDINLALYDASETLARYARSSDVNIINATSENLNDIKKYIKRYTVSQLTDMISNADFKNTKMTSWPKCFSYDKDGSLYFSIKLSSKLGNYAIIKYTP